MTRDSFGKDDAIKNRRGRIVRLGEWTHARGAFILCITGTIFLALPLLALQQAAQQRRTLNVNGHKGEITVLDIEGRSYVELEALARIANASLSSNGTEISLTIPPSPGSEGHVASATPGFSKEFLRAAIEQMAVIREWRIALQNAVQHTYPVTEDWVSRYRNEAVHDLRLATTAATTEFDRKVVQLLTNELNNMNKSSERFLQANRSRTYVRPDALDRDPLDQKILNCAHSLAGMAATGQFVDDGSCH